MDKTVAFKRAISDYSPKAIIRLNLLQVVFYVQGA
jgi:hypothetical protein